MDYHFFFFVGLAFLFTHEMDAIRCQEWTIFPGLARLNETSGFVLFMALHIPLYFFLLWGIVDGYGLNREVVKGLNIFFVAHAVAHGLFLMHPKNKFKSVLSWVLILGSAIAGLIDLWLN